MIEKILAILITMVAGVIVSVGVLAIMVRDNKKDAFEGVGLILIGLIAIYIANFS